MNSSMMRLDTITVCQISMRIGLAQFEQIRHILRIKQHLARYWDDFFDANGASTRKGQPKDIINNWLMAIEMNQNCNEIIFLKKRIMRALRHVLF